MVQEEVVFGKNPSREAVIEFWLVGGGPLLFVGNGRHESAAPPLGYIVQAPTYISLWNNCCTNERAIRALSTQHAPRVPASGGARAHMHAYLQTRRKVTKKARLDERFVSTSFPPLTHIVPDSFRHIHCFDPLPTSFVSRFSTTIPYDLTIILQILDFGVKEKKEACIINIRKIRVIVVYPRDLQT